VRHSFANLSRKKLNPPKGEKHHSAKLTDTEIEEIRSLKGVLRNGELARKYSVSPALITKIQKGIYRASFNPMEQSNSET
jgi:hypothetical protein